MISAFDGFYPIKSFLLTFPDLKKAAVYMKKKQTNKIKQGVVLFFKAQIRGVNTRDETGIYPNEPPGRTYTEHFRSSYRSTM